MKKLLATTIVMTSLMAPLPVHESEAAITSQSTPAMKNATIDVKMTAENLKAMKAGKIKYAGIGMGSSLLDVKRVYGSPRYDESSRNYKNGNTYVAMAYGKGERLLLTAERDNVVTTNDFARIKVSGWMYDASDKHILKRDIEKTLGVATGGEGNMKRAGIISREYGKYLTVTYELNEDTNKWEATYFEVERPIIDEPEVKLPLTGKKLQDAVIDVDINEYNVKGMMNGMYHVAESVRLGMSISESTKLLGNPRAEVLERYKDVSEITQVYGKGDRLLISASEYGYVEDTKVENMRVSKIIYDLTGRDIEKRDIEQYTGSGIVVEGSVKKDEFVTRQYGKYMTVDYYRNPNTKRFEVMSIIIAPEPDADGNIVLDKYELDYDI